MPLAPLALLLVKSADNVTVSPSQPIGPLFVEFCQADHGASICITHPQREVVAIIGPTNGETDPDMESAQHEPWDAAYAHLFAAAPDLLAALRGILYELKPLYTLPNGEPDIAGRPWLVAACKAIEKAETIDPLFLAYPLPDDHTHECQNCDWKGPEAMLDPIVDIHERVAPGEPMPSGQCPRCGCLCHPIEKEPVQ